MLISYGLKKKHERIRSRSRERSRMHRTKTDRLMQGKWDISEDQQ